MTRCKEYPLYIILITISVLTSSSTANNSEDIQVDYKSVSPTSSSSATLLPFASKDELINVPISTCDSASQQKRYADLTAAHLSPPCEKARGGYCGLRRNQNYTLALKFLTKVSTKSLAVRVTTIDPNFGWESQLWPEFSVCSGYNITCPQNPNNSVEAFLHEALPSGFPSVRGLVRVRLLGSDDFGIQKVYICRQFNMHVY